MSDSENINLDQKKIDEATLALLWVTAFKSHKNDETCRAWKGHDFDTMSRLHDKGLICDPVNKSKSIVLTPEGEKMATELCRKMFGRD